MASIDAYMGRLGQELGRIQLKKKLRMNEWAPEIARVEAALNRKPMNTLRGNAPRDVEEAIKSNDPEKKVIVPTAGAAGAEHRNQPKRRPEG